MTYLVFKAIHIIGFVSWFSGLFYLVRLFVYHREAWDRNDEAGVILRNQYEIMEGRLLNIIQTPAMLLTIVGGVGMLWINPDWLSEPWMHIKLTLVLLLMIYHFGCYRQLKALKGSASTMSSFGYRLYNEVPTLALIAIVMLAVWKSTSGLLAGLLLLIGLGVIFFIAAKIYRRVRK